MQILYLLADTFINTFGITRPDEATRRRAAFFILGLLILLVIAVAAAGFLIYRAMH